MTQYLVRSPTSGLWMLAPLEGGTTFPSEAYAYSSYHPWLEYMVVTAREHGLKLRLRQVHVPTPADPVHTDA